MRRAAGVLTGLLLVLASGCGTGPEPERGAPDAGFPVTITHGLGTTVVPAKPRRVVAVGTTDVQVAHALGAEIVATTRNTQAPDGNWPAVDPPLPPEVMVADVVDPNLEQIAALAPDLILVTAPQPGWTAAYDRLSVIAPTIPFLTSALEDEGDELLTVIARALGETPRAEAIRAAADARIARFRAEHPGLEGRRVAFGQHTAGATYLTVSPTASSSRFLGRLGLRLPDELVALAGSPGVQLGLAPFSGERLGVIDRADLALVSAYGPGVAEAFSSQPVIRGSRIEREGRLQRMPVNLAGAILTPNPVVTGYVLDELDPLVAGAGF